MRERRGILLSFQRIWVVGPRSPGLTEAARDPPLPLPDRLRPSSAVDNFGACGKVQYQGEWRRRENTLRLARQDSSTAAAKLI
jgi:hypothetical protein